MIRRPSHRTAGSPKVEIRAKTIDRRFGDNVKDIVRILEKLKKEGLEVEVLQQ